MHLVPTPAEVIDLLRRTGALRDGHFECLNGLHTDTYLDMALALRCYTHQKTLSVGLSRLLRQQPEIRAVLHELSIVTVTTAGLPIAWGLGEALGARQVYWAEKPDRNAPMRFRQYLQQVPGEKVVLVDDVLRAGRLVAQGRDLVRSLGAEVVAVAVTVHQPTPCTVDLSPIPVYSLARLESTYYSDPAHCRLCRERVPLVRQECAAQAIGV